MLSWIVRIAAGAALLLLAAFALGWAVLALPLFSDIRAKLVSEFLSEQIGQPLLIEGDVSVHVAPTSIVRARNVRIPSENLADVDLAKLDFFEFDIDLFALWERRVNLNNLIVDGLYVNILIKEDGTASFSDRDRIEFSETPSDVPVPAQPEDQKDAPAQGQGLLAFLKTRTASFTSIGLVIDNEMTGFEFDFLLEEFALNQLDGGTTLEVTSDGTVNGQPFSIKGLYPEAKPFTTRAEFSTVAVTFDGEPVADDEGGGFTGDLNVDVAAVGDLLEVLRLQRSFDGTGGMSMRLSNRNGLTSASGLDIELALAEGQLISVKGDVENIERLGGVDLQVDARLYPENQPPPVAGRLAELKLTRITTGIVSGQDALELVDLVFATNAFQQGLDEIGPIAIGRIHRTEDATLAFENIALQAGPSDDPVLVARGDIFDVLSLRNLSFEGGIDLPAALVLRGLGEEDAEAFGEIEAEFEVDDADGALRLRRLVARAVETDVWAMQTRIQVVDMMQLEGLEADFSIDIASGANFLRALELEPVDTGAFAFGMSVEGHQKRWNGNMELSAGESALKSTATMQEEDGRQTFRMDISSDVLVIDDLGKGIAVLKELGKLGKKAGADANPAPQDKPEIELQPLVLREKANDAGQPAASSTAPDQDISTTNAVSQLADVDRILRETDVYGKIDLKKISGIRGVTRVSSDFVSEGGKARLGPVAFAYGGGYFNFQARADVINAPEAVSLSGAVSGWSLSQILSAAGVKFDAEGDIKGRFDISANISSAQTFINSMVGTATVEMRDGRVATSLLELAGLGIFPWLFSDEFRKGYTDIVCVNAPVQIKGPTLSSDRVVAETSRVQMVVRGAIDAKRDTISLRAEPRPVGKPLARSAWPFEVSGKLSNPRFKLLVGGSRSRRADGASTMPAQRVPCQPDIYQLR